VTALHPGLSRRARVAALDDSSSGRFARLLAADPIVNVVLDSRVRAVGSVQPKRLGGTVYAVREGNDLVAACFSGGNLIPVGGDPASWTALARIVAERARICTSIVGRADAVAGMWPVLSERWGQPRAIRREQPLLVTSGPIHVPGDDAVRAARPEDTERYLAAAATMFTEELGVSPHVAPGSAAFRRRVDELIRTGRAFGSFDRRGQVVFKADIGALTAHTCQIQGVWVRPDLRGRGIGTAALATVVRHGLTLAPTVSLYVNDFNTAARRVYAKLGMHQHSTLSTVLL
jgi:uncharacterized protein